VRGFTLLEIMIALAIMAGTLLTLLSAFNHHLALVARDREETVALLLARGKLEELEMVPAVSLSPQEGTFAPERPAFTWKLVLSPTAITGLRQLTLTVFWDDKRKSLSLDHYK
jgi:general secretion pathway protein I